MIVFQILRNYHEAFAAGLGVTLRLCLIIWSSGLLLGAVLGVASTAWKHSIGIPARFASFTLSGIPIIVLLFWLHYPVQAAFSVVIDPFITAAVALSLVN